MTLQGFTKWEYNPDEFEYKVTSYSRVDIGEALIEDINDDRWLEIVVDFGMLETNINHIFELHVNKIIHLTEVSARPTTYCL